MLKAPILSQILALFKNKPLKALYIILLFITTSSYAQLHHHMISSQGSTSKIDSGIVITQTIGQQSVTGNYENQSLKIGQGYQQANWSKIILELINPELEVAIYPNPFNDNINIQHNSDEDITINIFNPAGMRVYNSVINVTGSIQTVNLEQLPSGVYLIHLQSIKLTYFTKLIKK